MNPKKSIAFIGAGPACLTSAYQLAKTNNFDIKIFEQDPQFLGGLSKTITIDQYHFDIGGHRFFSKSEDVRNIWKELLPNDMLERKRKSRIFYKNKFFHYPLRPWEALRTLGFFEAFLCICSYLKVRVFPLKNIKSFEDWVTNQFGERLFKIFFKTYTEKVWGMKCDEISSDWAAQRIKNLSLSKAIFDSFSNKSSGEVQSLIDKFDYPKNGPGMMWESCGRKIKELNGEIYLGQKVCSVKRNSDRTWTIKTVKDNQIDEYCVDYLVSSTELSYLVKNMEPPLPDHIKSSGARLKYRDFLMVALVVEDNGDIFDDQWIYVHAPEVKVGRIQNFKSWSPFMVPNEKETCLGMEYFCFENDDIWNLSDDQLAKLAVDELNKLNLLKSNLVLKTHVIRQKKAYPVYDDFYQDGLKIIKEYLNVNYPTLYTIGRNGMHQYNNQDHAMMTGVLVAKNIIEGSNLFNHWQVNQQAEYIECEKENYDLSLRMVPRTNQ